MSKTVALRPASDVITQLGQTPSVGNHFAKLRSGISTPNDLEFVTGSVAGTFDRYGIDSPPPDLKQTESVKLRTRTMTSGLSTGLGFQLVVNGVVKPTIVVVTGDGIGDWITNELTLADWQFSKGDAVELVVSITPIDGPMDLSEVELEVTYSPATQFDEVIAPPATSFSALGEPSTSFDVLSGPTTAFTVI